MKKTYRAVAAATALVLAVAFCTAGTAGAQTSALPAAKDLSAFVDTYWYVPAAYLPALKYTAHGSPEITQVNDQTIWHITGAGNGYLTGCSFTATAAGC